MSASTSDKYLEYRGDLTSLVGHGPALLLTTCHPEQRPTAVYRVDTDKLELTVHPLPSGGSKLASDGSTLFVAGDDGRLYHAALSGTGLGDLVPLGDALASAPAALVPLGNGRLGVLCADTLHIRSTHDGTELQRLALPDGEVGTALAADPTGTWLVAGTQSGSVTVFECEDRDDLIISETARLHEGAVTAISFEPDELRVLTAGVDNELRLTHVRGKLEPEDRARSAGHTAAVMAMLQGPDDKFYSVGQDAALKTWTRGAGHKRPSTIKEGVEGAGRGLALATVEVRGRPHLAVAADDNTIRLFQLDAAGKIDHRALVIHDAYERARHALQGPDARKDVPRRQAALDTLATYDDRKAIDLIAQQATTDEDHGLKVRATELLGRAANRRAVVHLETLLKSPTGAIRMAALTGLRTHQGEATLEPLDQALAVRQADVGVAAVDALEALAPQDDQAKSRLVDALDEHPKEVRTAALFALERLHPDDSAQADLIALETTHGDLRWRALVRCFQRGFLDQPPVQGAIRRHGEDADDHVRQTAFHISLLSRPTLASALRHGDRNLHRQLHQLETLTDLSDVSDKADAAPDAAPAKLPKTKAVKRTALDPADHRPLLEAMASRALDTCVQGALYLAQLQDPRAFGTLLQLSREANVSARVEACKAFERLGDPRGAQRLRLMLRDGGGEVRDASFTALCRLLGDKPTEALAASEAGLLADHEDVRRRGLQVLVKLLKKGLTQGLEAQAHALLARALNDASETVRGEAFKAAINLQAHGGGADSLRFVLRSLHADIRREVLTEVMGEIAQPWAWPLLLELFDDPDPGLRRDAFEFAQKKTRKAARDAALEPLARGLEGRFDDIRLEATRALAKKRLASAPALLVGATDDENREIRRTAIEALEHADAQEALAEAMRSRHADVRVWAAAARAELGDAEALDPLQTQIRVSAPEVSELRTAWTALTVQALKGLAALGMTDAVDDLRPLLDHGEAEIRRAAAQALAWCVAPKHPDALKEALRHTDGAVKQAAGLGLAWLGDPTGASVVFPKTAVDTGSGGRQGKAGKRKATQKRSKRSAEATHAGAPPGDALIAALALDADDLFLAYLDHTDTAVRARALRLLMLQEWSENDGVPDRCLAALSSADPRVRLTAARALEHFGDLDAFALFVVALMNDRADQSDGGSNADDKPWTLDAATIGDLAQVVTHGNPRLKARAAGLLSAFDEDKQTAFERLWHRFATRYAKDLKALRAAAAKRKPAKPAYAPEALDQLVFGAYVGLSRQPGGHAATRVRQTAVARLLEMGRRGTADRHAVAPVLVQALGDSNQAVRKHAFEALRELEYDAPRLSADALATGKTDMGVLGLKLLAEQAGEGAGAEVLERVVRAHTDNLEHSAAELLAEQRGWVVVHTLGLDAQSQALRHNSVQGLARHYAQPAHPDAADALRGALGSRFRAVQVTAAIALARHRDPAAFDPLAALLASDNLTEQHRAILALVALGDTRAGTVLMDRVDHDPAGTAAVDELFEAVGQLRHVADAERAIGYMQPRRTRRAAFEAALTLSGYDQTSDDDPDPDPDESKRKGQHPRHDDILARLLDVAYAVGDGNMLDTLLNAAKGSRSSAVDPHLVPLAAFKRADVRLKAIEVMAWRLEHRSGPDAALVAALEHRDPNTQFAAACGLAQAGRGDGLSVLLPAIDLLEDLDLRVRAVEALGRLGDPRALDPLLRLANDPEHALHEYAVEGIGRLAQTDRADSIFKLLKRLAVGGTEASGRALRGLRWFGTHDAWGVIRQRATDEDWSVRETVAELLGFNDDPATRQVLAAQVKSDDDRDVAYAAAASLRRQHGRESLEPDYIIVQSEHESLEEDTTERLCKQGDPTRLLEILPHIPPSNVDTDRTPLVESLLGRTPLPVDAAGRALATGHAETVAAAAQILGRAGPSVADAHGETLVATLDAARKAWHEAMQAVDEDQEDSDDLTDTLERATAHLQRLVWACGRAQVGADALIDAATLGGDAPAGRPVRAWALTALADGLGGAKGLDVLAKAATGADAEMRIVGAQALSRLAPARAHGIVDALLDDRGSLDRVVAGADADAHLIDDALRSAVARVHVQGVVLPHLIERRDIDGLARAMADCDLPEAARLGALEALARIDDETALDHIVELARDERSDETLRRAAWRARRRLLRMRHKHKSPTGREVRS